MHSVYYKLRILSFFLCVDLFQWHKLQYCFLCSNRWQTYSHYTSGPCSEMEICKVFLRPPLSPQNNHLKLMAWFKYLVCLVLCIKYNFCSFLVMPFVPWQSIHSAPHCSLSLLVQHQLLPHLPKSYIHGPTHLVPGFGVSPSS